MFNQINVWFQSHHAAILGTLVLVQNMHLLHGVWANVISGLAVMLGS